MSPETALSFDCGGQTLVGVASLPAPADLDPPPGQLGVVIVVGGPQYRAGSHRQFVLLARAMAGAGFPVLRFDCRGMGDSEGDPRGFEDLDADIASAIAALQREAPQVRSVVLCGLCDGASASLLYLQRQGQDPRVAGLVLMNPWVRTATGQAQTRVRHYYLERLLSKAFWLKLLGGGVAKGALREAMASLKLMLSSRRERATSVPEAARHFSDRMADGCAQFQGQTLIVTSGRDYTAKEFLLACAGDTRWQQVLARSSTRHVNLASADHTFADSRQERELHRQCLRWLQGLRQTLRA